MNQKKNQREPKPNIQLKRARIKNLWTIEIAAQRVGVSDTAYLRWEEGKQTPQLVNLQALCTAFSSTAEDLGYGSLMLELEPSQKVNSEQLQEAQREIEGWRNRWQRESQNRRMIERRLADAEDEIERLRQDLTRAQQQSDEARAMVYVERERRAEVERKLNEKKTVVQVPLF